MLFFLKAVSFVLGHIPRRVAYALGCLLGALASRLFKRHRRTALENLERAFGDSLTQYDRERIMGRVFKNLGVMFFEFNRMAWLKREDIGKFIEFKGLERIEEALKRGKGVLLLTAHYGNWELLHAALGHRGYTLELVVRRLDSPLFEQFVKWVRTRSGINIVYKVKAMLPLVRRLNSNSVAMILADQNTVREEGYFVDFFGVPTCTNKGPALLAQKTGAAVLPVFIVREGSRHRVEVWEEIELANTGDKDVDAEQNTAAFARAVEKAIRARPEQWFWVHRRWKTRP
jgi:KDO2-lipid IV(A) lauroyltransferase